MPVLLRKYTVRQAGVAWMEQVERRPKRKEGRGKGMGVISRTEITAMLAVPFPLLSSPPLLPPALPLSLLRDSPPN